MATLKEIRNKLRAVKNIQKITKAMEMVAASRLKKAQLKAERARPYFTYLKKMLEKQIAAADQFVHPLIDKREVAKTCIVIITGDRGLCGSYNQNIITAAEKKLAKYNPEQVELILIGKKAVDHFSHKHWKIGHTIINWGGKITYSEVKALAGLVMEQYLTHKYDEIFLIYTHYLSAVSRRIVVDKLLRIEPETSETSLDAYIIEPNISEILSEILPHYIITKIQLALNESYASELAARVFSMRAATNNANDMIEDLTLVRNQIRQSTITKELIEITSCAECLK